MELAVLTEAVNLRRQGIQPFWCELVTDPKMWCTPFGRDRGYYVVYILLE